jgi:hypothetical protein
VTGLLASPPDFETFVLDAANRSAAAAARAVADGSGVPYAPLVVVGPPGSGKTELLQAIAGRIRALHPSAVVELLSPDGLAERYRSALLVARGEMCRAELQAADLVLVDDLERLARHQDCQGLVADLLDGRRGAGREVVVATAVPIERLTGLDARLLRRLVKGRPSTCLSRAPRPAMRSCGAGCTVTNRPCAMRWSARWPRRNSIRCAITPARSPAWWRFRKPARCPCRRAMHSS